ncbi:ABC transporter permease [Alloacidobacterium sp.]|uniref:ABC transporter permease n=1 Tax=Alloacidobacterium sp. TaxID=2951999 RepID=UPI002D6A1025|nr:ABC transporter permease [Alloacidobacterium sp.]HYK38051.1 ABC transporter permease [Alloacidobacterium sp.]
MRKLRALWIRLRGMLRRDEADNGFSAELESHLQMHMEDNLRSGMTPEEARRQALIKLGGIEQTRQAYRERERLPQLETLWQDIRFGLRMLRKSPGFTVAAAGTLALGIGANTAIFSVVKAVLLAPLPYKDSGRIVAVWTANPARGGEPRSSTAADFAIWKQRTDIFEDLAPSYDDEKTLTGQGAPQFLIGYAVSANYLRILGVEPRLGRLYTNQEDRPGGPKVALLSDHLWRTTFHSDPGIVGRAITLDGTPYTVLGIMPRGFDYPSTVEVWTPVAMAPSAFDDFKHDYVRILGRLKPGVTLTMAQKAVNAVETKVAAAHPDTDSGNRVVLVPLREELDGDIRSPLLVLMGAVGIVLLIACANTAGLALARDAERQKEIAVRLALGATRTRLLRQFVTESLLLAAMGGAAGMLLAFAGTHSLLALFPNDVANLNIPKVTAIPIDYGVFLFATAITLLTAFLFGIAPVMKATRVEAGDAMRESARGSTSGRRSNRSRSVIVVTQIALALMLLTGAGLVTASFRHVVNSDPGFQPDHVLSLQVLLPLNRYPSDNPQKRRAFVAEALRRMNALPGVESAAATNYLPLSGFWGTTNFLLRGQAPVKEGQAPEADERLMTPEYLRTMGIPLLRGRAFTDADRAGSAQVAMINQTLAKQYFKDKDPIGEELNLGSSDKPDWWRIVGMTGDVKAFGQDQPTHADIYQPFDQQPFPLIAFVLRTKTDPAAIVKAAEQALWNVDPDLPVLKAIPMDLLANQTRAVRRASSVLISAFAVLALVLACVGIYGLMAYAVTQRTQEIGVRMALGAQSVDVLRLMLGFGIRIAFLGLMIGLAGAVATTRLLASLLFEVNAMNPLIFSLSVAVLILVVMIATWLPAKRAASIDPMHALRTE